MHSADNRRIADTIEVAFHCSRCGCRKSDLWTKSRWEHSAAFRCPRCGCTHHVEQGQFTAISPAMLPWTSTGKASPWFGAEYIPAKADGWYQCCTIEGTRCILYWNGRYWSWLGQRVTGIHKWRGHWE